MWFDRETKARVRDISRQAGSLVSVLWVFFGLSTVAGLLSCYIKGQKAEREQGLRDKAAESRAMTYVVCDLTLAMRQSSRLTVGIGACRSTGGRITRRSGSCAQIMARTAIHALKTCCHLSLSSAMRISCFTATTSCVSLQTTPWVRR